LAYRLRQGSGPALVWLGGFRSDMGSTKALALDQWGAGHGRVVRQQGFFQVQQACPTCEGAGQRIDDPCTACKGRGAVPQTVPLHLTIPAGVESGHTERIAGPGEPGDGGG
jgi:DnaJ-class molecular chaperone